MNAADIDFAVNHSTAENVRQHLLLSDGQFEPPLSQRVNIENYANRIADHAMRFEAWAETHLIGLVAAYFNVDKNRFFITNVSTIPSFGGQGIARTLLEKCLQYADSGFITSGHLEVGSRSVVAISLYRRFGFQEVATQGEILQMRRIRIINSSTSKGST